MKMGFRDRPSMFALLRQGFSADQEVLKLTGILFVCPLNVKITDVCHTTPGSRVFLVYSW